VVGVVCPSARRGVVGGRSEMGALSWLDDLIDWVLLRRLTGKLGYPALIYLACDTGISTTFGTVFLS